MVLFHKLFSLSQTYKHLTSKCKPKKHPNWSRQGYCYEAMLCFISILLPLTVIWVPFVSEQGSRYGLYGPWCWIQHKDPITCEETTDSILERVLLRYAPLGIVAFVSLLCIALLLVSFCYLRINHGFLEKQTRAVIKGMLPLFTFWTIFCVVWLIENVITGISEVTQIYTFALWMVYAVITPIKGIVVPIGFFIYLFYSTRLTASSHQFVNVDEYSDLQTGKDANRFIHNLSRISAASHTSDRDSRQFLSNSNEFTTTDQKTMLLHGTASAKGSKCIIL